MPTRFIARFFAHATSAPPRVPDSLRVITYNIHSCVGRDGKARPDRIAAVLEELQPDVVALQEVDVGTRCAAGGDQAAEIAQRLGMQVAFHPAQLRDGGQYGIAVLSRHPMEPVRAATLPRARLRRIEPRVALGVRVHLDGASSPWGGGHGAVPIPRLKSGAFLNLVNTHLGLIGEERRRQVEMLLGPDWLGDLCQRGPTILCGDLNSVPGSTEHRRLRTLLFDPVLVGRLVPTFPSAFPLVRLDHVLISAHLESVTAAVMHGPHVMGASDHCPVLADLRIRNPHAPPPGKPAPGTNQKGTWKRILPSRP